MYQCNRLVMNKSSGLFPTCKCQYINVQKVENKNVHFPAITLSGFQQRLACLSSDMTVL